MEKRKDSKQALYVVIILILVIVFLLSGLQILESTVLHTEQEPQSDDRKTIVRDGIEYFPRQDITVMLVMGIDQAGPVVSSDYYRNEGAADLVMVLIFDEAAQDFSILYLNRDTMLEMPVLGLGGQQAGTAYAQLALAHTYGDGLESSCENTRKAVSDLFYGLQIDYYLSVNMDAVGVINDAVGGVTVTVTDDFSYVDPSIAMGEVTLTGQQAIHFVRTRKGVGDQLNLSRIQRQMEYIRGFTEAFRAAMEADGNALVKMYESVSAYLVTDCSANAMSGIFSRFQGYPLRRIVTPEGENVLGEKYYEFHLDEEKLDALILELFYRQK